MKPNNRPLYINAKSNHPPTINRHLLATINRRISDISCHQEAFNKAKLPYEEALRASGFNDRLSYDSSTSMPRNRNKNRKRNIIWYTPPFNKSVQTNIGKSFLSLIQKHFPTNSKFHNVFNKNDLKVSCSGTQNMESITSKHNKTGINTDSDNAQSTCNCRKREQCPLGNNYFAYSVIYKASITTSENNNGKNYI